MLVLNSDDIAGLMTWPDIIETCENVFRWIDKGEVFQEHVSPIYFSDGNGMDGFAIPFPACIVPLGVIGNKWGGGSPRNRARGLRSFNATITLNDMDTALPIALLEGGSITSMRTGAHAAIGAKYLARPDSTSVAVIGCGEEGRSFLHAMSHQFDITDVRAVARTRESAEKYAAEVGAALDLSIEVYDEPREAVKGTDIICMCTSASESILDESWVEPGAHVAATRAFIDFDPTLSATADKWVLGNRESDGGWLKKPPFANIKGIELNSVYGDLVEIVAGRKPGREHEHERTVMTHMGMGAMDVAVAYELYLKAKKIGRGTSVDI